MRWIWNIITWTYVYFLLNIYFLHFYIDFESMSSYLLGIFFKRRTWSSTKKLKSHHSKTTLRDCAVKSRASSSPHHLVCSRCSSPRQLRELHIRSRLAPAAARGALSWHSSLGWMDRVVSSLPAVSTHLVLSPQRCLRCWLILGSATFCSFNFCEDSWRRGATYHVRRLRHCKMQLHRGSVTADLFDMLTKKRNVWCMAERDASHLQTSSESFSAA